MVQFSGFASLVLCIQTRILSKLSGFPHSDITGSLLYCQLSDAFRRLTRPSSPIIAKASTWCTYSLDSIIWRTFWLRYNQRWRLPITWILYFDKAYCLLCLNPAFCVSGLSRYNHHPNFCIRFICYLKQSAFRRPFGCFMQTQTLLRLFVDFGFPIC